MMLRIPVFLLHSFGLESCAVSIENVENTDPLMDKPVRELAVSPSESDPAVKRRTNRPSISS